MKKRLIIVVSILILVCLISFIAYSNYTKEKRDAITGETVTGEATGGGLAVVVSVIVETPNVTLIYSENKTYITTQNLWLNYSVSYTYAVWYSIDNVENITLTENILFNTTSGPHTIRIYANNTEGILVSDNVTFTVDLSKFNVIYDEYASSTKGSSTDFNKSSYEDLQNLSSIVLEHTSWGKIEFNEAINISDDSYYDNECDLDSYTNISSNRIEINSTALPNFNKSATLYIYNLTFSNPRILRDGSICPDTICTEIDYTGGTLIFNVTQFTTYSAEETPSTPPTQQPSGGGGGGTAVVSTSALNVNPENIQVKLNQGEKDVKNIILTNDGKENLTVSIENPKLKDFIKISETNFMLEAGETKVIVLEIMINEDSIPDLYIGNLIINTKGIKKEISIVIEIESKTPLFDVNLKIPEKYLYVSPGEEVSGEISLYNLAGTGKVDVLVEYTILNKNGDEILHEQETIAVETSTSFVRSFKLPEGVGSGKYFLYVKTTYNGLVASASSQFNVGIAPPLTLSEQILFIVVGVLIILALIIFFEIRKIKKHIGHHKIDEHALMRKGLIKSPEKIFRRAFKKRGK